ncbi:carbohydrate esterase family 5 protein [Daldinia caldariorum]|uniref:carbohydrate esterase family 5 protein n=1 Tax=Daldinia caldariorum TaxID=326644 RepID=UPI002007632B|nr:carbohydrate esterase family 5 protein [Daldinia caldariorum]KAI1469060.1 carbohydrate esterase family 5 protein [Daldinia caldariorum]
MPDLRRRALLILSAAAVALAQETGADACTDVHIFLSRGNNEPYPGRQGKLVQAICAGLESCDYEDVAFNNALEVEYCGAVEEGRKAGVEQITAYNKRCPRAKLVVSGYSQGAHVLGDILGGGGGVFFQGCTTPTTPGLDPDSAPGRAGKFGSPNHLPYNTLEGAPFNGLFPRGGAQLEGLHNFAGVLRDWCQGDDPICAQGDGKRAYNVEHHLNYFDVYSDAAAEWVKSMLGDASTPSPSSSSTTESSKITPSSSSGPSTSSIEETSSSEVTTTTTTTSGTRSTSISSELVSSSSPSTTHTSTPLPEATNTDAPPTPTTSSTSHEGSARGHRGFKGHIGLSIVSSFLFVIA